MKRTERRFLLFWLIDDCMQKSTDQNQLAIRPQILYEASWPLPLAT